MSRRFVLASVLALAVVGLAGGGVAVANRPLLAAVAQEATPGAGASQGHPLVGAWLVREEGDPARAARAPALVVFTADGIVLETTPLGFNGVGSWAAEDARTATATVVYSTVDPDTGDFQWTYVVRSRVRVDPGGQGFAAEYTGTVVLPDESVGDTSQGAVSGARIPAESPEAGGRPLAGFPGPATPGVATPTP